MRPGTFFFNEKDSYDYGILIQTQPQRLGGQRRFNKINVTNRHGTFFHDKKIYDNSELKLKCVFINQDEFNYIDAVDQFFDVGEYVDFTPYYDENFTYRVIPTGPPIFNYKEMRGQAVTFEITFSVYPLKFFESGNRVYEFVDEITFLNPSFEEAKPIIKLYGSGTINLSVNDDNFTFKNVTDHVTIDSEELTCVGGDMVGFDYPIIGREAKIKTNATKAEITPRFVRRAV